MYHERIKMETLQDVAKLLYNSENSRKMLMINDSNSSTNTEIKPTLGDIMLVIFALLLSLLIVSVNSITIFVVRKSQRLHTLSNIYIVSLAVADLIVGLGLLPLSMFYLPSFRRRYYDQNVNFCAFVLGMNIGMAAVSTIHMALIATDRYIYITWPYIYQKKVRHRLIYIILCCTWIFGITFSLLPQLIHNKHSKLSRCDITTVMPIGYTFYSTLSIYTVCVVIDVVMYTQILIIANRQRLEIRSRSLSLDTNNMNGATSLPLDTRNLNGPISLSLDTHHMNGPTSLSLDTHNMNGPISLSLDTHHMNGPISLSSDTHYMNGSASISLDTHHINGPTSPSLDSRNMIGPISLSLDHNNRNGFTSSTNDVPTNVTHDDLTISPLNQSHQTCPDDSSDHFAARDLINIEITEQLDGEPKPSSQTQPTTELSTSHHTFENRSTLTHTPSIKHASYMKSVKFFMTVFGVYFVCLTPTVVCMGVDYYWHIPRVAYNLFNLLALLNSGMNFFIFLVLNTRFRMSVLRVLKCKRVVNRISASGGAFFDT